LIVSRRSLAEGAITTSVNDYAHRSRRLPEILRITALGCGIGLAYMDGK
jgi:hypothetical protein